HAVPAEDHQAVLRQPGQYPAAPPGGTGRGTVPGRGQEAPAGLGGRGGGDAEAGRAAVAHRPPGQTGEPGAGGGTGQGAGRQAVAGARPPTPPPTSPSTFAASPQAGAGRHVPRPRRGAPLPRVGAAAADGRKVCRPGSPPPESAPPARPAPPPRLPGKVPNLTPPRRPATDPRRPDPGAAPLAAERGFLARVG